MIRDAFTRHNTTYFVIDDVYAPFEGDDMEMPKDSKELSAKLARDIGEVFNLTFVRHETITKPFSNPFSERITYAFRCSQCEELAKNRPQHDDVQKRRKRETEPRFPCHGSLRITFPKSTLQPLFYTVQQTDHVNVPPKGALIRFSHAVYHEGRKRPPFPRQVREFISKNYKNTCHDMHHEILAAAKRGDLDTDVRQLTDHNIRYWWSLIRRERIETDKDPWKSTVNYLERQPNVFFSCRVHLISGNGIFSHRRTASIHLLVYS